MREEIDRVMRERSIDARVIMYGPRGSVAHGTSTDQGIDDVDAFVVYVGSLRSYLGIRRVQDSFNTNGADLDIEGMDLPKFMHLVGKQNPNVLSYLWTEDAWADERMGLIRASKQRLLSQRALSAIHGYAHARLKLMHRDCKTRYMGTAREALRQKYGYDVKAAAHALRLLRQGVIIARDRVLEVKVREEDLAAVMAVKLGERTLDEFTKMMAGAFEDFDVARSETTLPADIPWEHLYAITETTMEAVAT